jgi:UDP-N-acetylmuramyl pentapeptide phosphotransferase/UDP-N-acetylglucosamine-1-phosphate transferase
MADVIPVLFGGLEGWQLLLVLAMLSALLSFALIVGLMPVLRRYALARPNARSSHKIPTPQGGGMAVVAAACLPFSAIILLSEPDFKYNWGGGWDSYAPLAIIMAASAGLVVLGAIDDLRPLPVLPRLLLQLLAVSLAVSVAGPFLPLPDWIELPLLIIAGLWFVNLVNFMDGLDWITVAEMVPITGFIAILGSGALTGAGFGAGIGLATIIAASLCGALLGFAPFNKPVARLFLGDVGSLPIGLLVGWMLLQLAGTGALAAALLLPLYYLMDATITLLRRLRRREKVWEAHRSHFYQQATDNGFSALQVSAHVFGLNLVLAGLATMTLVWPSGAVQIAALVSGIALVGLVLRRFSTPRQTIPLEVSR